MSVLDLARPELLTLKPYSSARMEAGAAAVMLNANESAYAPFEDDTLGLNRYPEPQPPALLAALAAQYRVPVEQVFLGRGSDEAIDLLVRAFCRAGQDAVLVSPPTFGMYAVAAQVQGAQVISVPLNAQNDFSLDTDAVLAACADAPVKLVFVCSPNNPTGGLVPRATILRLAQSLEGRALVVVDEAYGEYSQASSLTSDLSAHANVCVLRTLSKAFGLAGARLGVLLADAGIIALLRRIMAPYPVPLPCAAAAMQALSAAATAGRELRIAQTLRERSRLAEALADLPCVRRVWPSAANFLAFELDDASARWRQLAERGVLVRDISHYLGLHNCLRVSIGSPDENNRFLAALAAASTSPAAPAPNSISN